MPLNPLKPLTEKVADGVWRHAGDLRRSMNVFLIADGDGVTMYDAGTERMVAGIREAAEPLGGVKRVVLGHAHPDHRGAAPGLGVPVLCHPDAVADAESDGGVGDFHLELIDWWFSRAIYPSLLRHWDGGPVKIAGTVSEGEEVAGFRAVHFPGHARGLIGLWRERDRLILCSDVIYLVDSIRLKRAAGPSVPHRTWNLDHEEARESVRKLAAMEPRTVWTGHTEALTGEPRQLRALLERAADAA